MNYDELLALVLEYTEGTPPPLDEIDLMMEAATDDPAYVKFKDLQHEFTTHKSEFGSAVKSGDTGSAKRTLSQMKRVLLEMRAAVVAVKDAKRMNSILAALVKMSGYLSNISKKCAEAALLASGMAIGGTMIANQLKDGSIAKNIADGVANAGHVTGSIYYPAAGVTAAAGGAAAIAAAGVLAAEVLTTNKAKALRIIKKLVQEIERAEKALNKAVEKAARIAK